MEVVSPLNFPHSNQNGKRRFACSPIRDASSTNVANVLDSSDDFEMDDSAGFGFQASKRRRKLSNDVGVDSRSQWAVSSFASATFSGRLSPNSSGESRERPPVFVTRLPKVSFSPNFDCFPIPINNLSCYNLFFSILYSRQLFLH
mmetsp:Transcript_370/g.763  ORF Transcript_370/g.763 Transcript_370/m.763 type:complete len:145 (-) Transcript_370:136-570(-)